MKQQTIQKTKLLEGWKIVRLEDVIELIYGKGLIKNKRKNGKTPVYGSNGIIGYHNKPLINFDTIIIGRKGSVGALQFVEGKCWPIDTTYYVKLKYESDIKFIYYLLSNLNLIKFESSTAIPGINRNQIYNIEVPLPPLPTQKLIVKKLNSFFEKYNKLKEEKQKAKENYERILGSVISTLIPSGDELPKGWEMKTIQEMIEGNIIADINPGFPSGKHHKNEKGYVHIRPMNVNLNGEIDYTTCKYVDRKKEYNNYILEKDDIIFNNTNSRELVGKTALFKNKKECVYSNHMTRIKVDNKKILPYYLAVYLHNLWRKGFFSVICHSHVSQASVSTNKLKETKIPLPSLELQHQIITKLEAIKQKYSKICEEQKLLDSYLKQLPKAVLSKAFKGEL